MKSIYLKRHTQISISEPSQVDLFFFLNESCIYMYLLFSLHFEAYEARCHKNTVAFQNNLTLSRTISKCIANPETMI